MTYITKNNKKSKSALIIAAVTAFSLCLCGCSKSSDTPQAIPDSYSFNVNVKHGELELEALCTRDEDGVWTAEISQPQTVSGMKISLDSENCTASLGELSQTFKRENMPVGGTINLLTQMLDSVKVLNESTQSSESLDFTYDRRTKILEETSSFEGESFTVSFCNNDLYMAEMESEGFCAVITDYHVN